jgi:hypothetical protein
MLGVHSRACADASFDFVQIDTHYHPGRFTVTRPTGMSSGQSFRHPRSLCRRHHQYFPPLPRVLVCMSHEGMLMREAPMVTSAQVLCWSQVEC